MTKTKNYKYGEYTFKTYFKPVGHGYEVGLVCDGKPYFVGNFVHLKEAKEWWTKFQKEIQFFAKKYWCVDETPYAWYCHFLSNHLYKTYYAFLDKLFNHYNKSFSKAYTKDVKKYFQMKKAWTPEYKYGPIKKVA